MRNSLVLLIITLTALIVVAVMQSSGQENERFYNSGNAFARACSPVNKQTAEMSATEISEGVKCAVYVKGLFDGIQAERTRVQVTEPGRTTKAFFCEESFTETENGQVVRILLKYIKENPEKAHQPVSALFMFAMREAFPPCSS